MSSWLRITLRIAILLAVLAVSAAISRAPTIPHLGTPPILKLLRRGTAEPELTAEAVLIERLKNGETLFGRNADARLPIASLTKLMTALLLAEEIEPLAEVEFSSSAKEIGAADDKRSAVLAGERLRAEDVLAMLLISSDNDAAYAVAEHVAARRRPELRSATFPERISAFVGLMNERAAELGLANTHFANPAGRDHPENFSSARDLGRLAAFIARERPALLAASRTRETFVFGARGRRYGLVNTDPLLGEFPALYGSKTGFEENAKGALLLLYQLAPDDPMAIVLLRSSDRFGDGRSAIGWLESGFMLESPASR